MAEQRLRHSKYSHSKYSHGKHSESEQSHSCRHRSFDTYAHTAKLSTAIVSSAPAPPDCRLAGWYSVGRLLGYKVTGVLACAHPSSAASNAHSAGAALPTGRGRTPPAR